MGRRHAHSAARRLLRPCTSRSRLGMGVQVTCCTRAPLVVTVHVNRCSGSATSICPTRCVARFAAAAIGPPCSETRQTTCPRRPALLRPRPLQVLNRSLLRAAPPPVRITTMTQTEREQNDLSGAKATRLARRQ